MALFLRWTFIYFACAMSLDAMLRGDMIYAGLKLLRTSGEASAIFTQSLALLALILGLSRWTSAGWRDFGGRLARGAVALLACLVFLAAFSSVKSTLPYLAELLGQRHFFADPFLADLDRALHFGVDPWRLTHGLTGALGLSDFATLASGFYGPLWAMGAFYLPALAAVLGSEGRQFRHFILLYMFTWVALGNLTALAGLSAGPVYYDALFGTARFAELHPALSAGGLETSWFGVIQPWLWDAYVEADQAVGTGISAFPSVHVAMAAVLALFLGERSRALRLPAWSFVGAILFISVWTGYHYAIDGYVSIAAVLLAHRALKSRAARPAAPVAVAAE